MFSGVTVRRVHSSSKEYIKGGLYKIDCQLTANKGGRGGGVINRFSAWGVYLLMLPLAGRFEVIVTSP